MPVITKRAQTNADVSIDHTACNLCGLCVNICKGKPLYIENGKVQVDQSILFGCIGCGQCAAICPNHCITVEGREMTAASLVDLPKREQRADYTQLKALLTARRSTRCFKNKEVPSEIIAQILEAVATAPIGIPPSEVEVLVLNGFEKVHAFSQDMVALLQSRKWLFSPFMLGVLRPFVGKDTYNLLKTFAAPLPNFFAKKMAMGEDWLLYGAPLAMYFHTSPTADPIDFAIAGTYAMLAGEALGLGTCMIGSIAPFLKNCNPVSEKYGIPRKNTQGIMVLFGYPAYQYRRAIQRTLSNVHYY